MENVMLRVAIIGCGKIADAHAAQIRRVKGAQIVGVCDAEPLMARQLAERFSVQRSYGKLTDLLTDARPDVVHITTPPESHFSIAAACLQANCHVYIEKPFTVYVHEAQDLIRMASAKGLAVTVGHDYQFMHVAQRMRALVKNGYLGGRPVHMESYNSIHLGRAGYGGALLNDKYYWERRLPGKLLQNNISHGVARIAEFLTSDSPKVVAHGFTSPFLKSLGETDIIDELRVIISEDEHTTAYLTFSSQMRPSLHQFRIYGPRNGLFLDQYQQTLIKLRGSRFKLYAEHFVPPVLTAGQYLGNLATNMKTFLARDFHMKSGMKYLIEGFYNAVREGAPVPIPYREILLTATVMDTMFAQLHEQRRFRPINETALTSA
jgi:predicted dehydrogenase